MAIEKPSLISHSLTSYIFSQLWAGFFVLPFLINIPLHSIPNWIKDSVTLCLILVLWFCLLIKKQLSSCFPQSAYWLLGLALLWLMQPLFVDIAFPGLNIYTSLLFVAMALLAYVSVSLQAYWKSETLIEWLAWALLVGAVLQAGVGLLQVTGLASQLHGLVAYSVGHETTNIYGTIGQRNLYAHYLTWGVLALGYLAAERKIGTFMAGGLVVFLTLLIGWSASRTSLLYFVAIIAIAILWHWQARDPRSYRLLVWLCGISAFGILINFALPFINDIFELQATASIERIASASGASTLLGRRETEWYKAWLVFLEYPLWGCGWSQFAAHSVSLQLLPQFADASFNEGLFTNAHNLLFHLLAEVGLIGTLAALGGFFWLIQSYFKSRTESSRILPLSMMCVTMLHSLFEYPLWSIGFLSVFIIAITLAPNDKPREDRGTVITKKYWPLLFSSFLAISLAYFLSVGWIKCKALEARFPTNNFSQNLEHVRALQSVIEEDTLYRFHALRLLLRFIKVDGSDVAKKRYYLDMFTQIRPYAAYLLQRAQLEALDKLPHQAKHSMQLALASFPTFSKYFLRHLSRNEPAFYELRRMAQAQYDRLPAEYKK